MLIILLFIILIVFSIKIYKNGGGPFSINLKGDLIKIKDYSNLFVFGKINHYQITSKNYKKYEKILLLGKESIAELPNLKLKNNTFLHEHMDKLYDSNKIKYNLLYFVMFRFFILKDEIIQVDDVFIIDFIKESFDYILVNSYDNFAQNYKEVEMDTIFKYGNVIISFNKCTDKIFDSEFYKYKINEFDKEKILKDIQKFPDSMIKQKIMLYLEGSSAPFLKYIAMTYLFILENFESKFISKIQARASIRNLFKSDNLCMSLPFIENDNLKIFGINVAAVSPNIILFGEYHKKYCEEYYGNKIDDSVQFSNYLSLLDIEMKKKSTATNKVCANIFLEAPIKSGLQDIKNSHNCFIIKKYFEEKKPENLILHYADIRGISTERDTKYFIKNFEAIIFSTDLFKDLNIVQSATKNNIMEIFGVEYVKDIIKRTKYEKYLENNPFMSRTAYEFFRLENESIEYKTCIRNLLQDKKLIIKNNTDLMALYTDLYTIARMLRKKGDFNICYHGRMHSSNFFTVFTLCMKVKFKFYGEPLDMNEEYDNKYALCKNIDFIEFDNEDELFFRNTESGTCNIL